MSKQHQIRSFIRYFATAKGLHGTHSPFVYSFIQDVLHDKRQFYAFEQIASLRQDLLADKQSIQVQDFGAGSLHGNTALRKVCEIAKNAGRTKKFGELLFRIVDYFQFHQILELGTSLGLATAYLAMASEKSNVVTVEGCPAVRAVAQQNFGRLGLSNVLSYLGNFDDILPLILDAYPTFDLIFIDGNHRKVPTMRYFNLLKQHIHPNSLIIFDDIHWSKEMEEAWSEIKEDPQVKVSIDLYQFGLVFFMNDVKQRQSFVLRY